MKIRVNLPLSLSIRRTSSSPSRLKKRTLASGSLIRIMLWRYFTIAPRSVRRPPGAPTLATVRPSSPALSGPPQTKNPPGGPDGFFCAPRARFRRSERRGQRAHHGVVGIAVDAGPAHADIRHAERDRAEHRARSPERPIPAGLVVEGRGAATVVARRENA